MKIKNQKIFYLGIIILIGLTLSYFVKINVDSGANYVTKDNLLGILIFHNLFVFIIYLLISLLLVFLSMKKIKIA